MIDVVFLLIIFFVLISTFASAERLPMKLPDPDASQAQDVKLTDRVIINVQLTNPDDPQHSDVVYNFGPFRVDSLADVSARLALHARLVPDLKIVIRADRRVRYGVVREVMEIVAENGVEKMNVAAYVGETGVSP